MSDAGTSAKRRAGNKSSTGDQRPSTKQSLTQALDTELYSNGNDKYAGYNTSIAVQDDDDMDDAAEVNGRRLVGQYTATKEMMNEFAHGATEEADILTSREEQAQIASRETEYQRRRFDRNLDGEDQSYQERMKAREIEREEQRVRKIIEDRERNGQNGNEVLDHVPTLKDGAAAAPTVDGDKTPPMEKKSKRKRRWGAAVEIEEPAKEEEVEALPDAEPEPEPEVKEPESKKPKSSRWETTPAPDTPMTDAPADVPAQAPVRSRWDTATAPPAGTTSAAPAAGDVAHPSVPFGFGTDISARNAPLSDEQLDLMLPSEGYKILEPPEGYTPVRKPIGIPQLPAGYQGYMIPESGGNSELLGKQMPTEIPGVGDLAFFKNEDMKYFGKLVDNVDENDLSVEQLKERKIMRLLLKVKNGTPPMRKTALRQLTDNARQFGAQALFSQILPLLMERTLEDQERHLLVKVIDRVLYKLDDLVRPWVHRILVVIEPLLIDQDYYARVEGREIISNLSKAAGLAHMISTMRPDLDHADEYVRNTTARAFAVVASALGIPALLPFLRAVCRSKKSWHARHTGVKIVQQIPILMGCAILPHLKGLVECVGESLNDEQPKVRMVTALALAALAEAASPYGIESFDEILNPLWTNARRQRGKILASYLKAIGFIIPLMDEEYSSYYTSQVMDVVIREFQSPDEEMKKVVLKVVSQCSGTAGVTPVYLKDHVLNEFFKHFWVRRMALDKRNYRQVVDTTVDLAQKSGVADIIGRIVNNMKDESEAYRKMTVETVDKVISTLGAHDVDPRLEEQLIDGVLVAFQDQTIEDPVVIDGFATVINALGERAKTYLPQIVQVVLFRLNNKSATVRQQAADLISRITITMNKCDEDPQLIKLAQALYEYLGEEYPEVLGSILGALRSIITVVGLHAMQPPIKDLLPRLTPILRNRHEKVQENTIDLVGRIADRGADFVPPREWMRICFELLEMLKAHKKGIRRAANNTFGYIAKAIGPQDVLATLLNNLRVQERQSRVCTAVAIGIVAETCAPFTVLPALMNEYRVPELNVQNGVLKALSFMFEYIGEMARDYVYAITPLLEDALIDRDQVHRQTAASVVKHVALGCVGLDCEDAMVHLLNLLWPNLFETSPHVIDRIIEAIDAVRNAVGTPLVMNYVWAGLFHPARKVRVPYWRIYNDAYVQSADAMIPAYPQFDDPELRRHELDIFI
ncbi:splicing factor 3B subunit 1 [Aaosphaeria arxii CBS 175.79]|uniref:Splicing factor 3B subunit 1 n=1 Tax=Aaosphaeria arxii CBS 175.79 TaxID=1450172 RepID=A0A6A5XKL4_9PLEO|nr:splicing factor 3B subunit 1 [Aaosphaeria arxii CBS 175.79]KAF2013493.1 splicing factor 3B subunit 1 [Aaosphaeria arxii CBS 175.79]